MAYITPNTTIELISVAMDPNYKHVRYFATLQDQFDFFSSHVILTRTANTYQNYTAGTIRIEASKLQTLTANYLRFRNLSHEQKTYYAFISSITEVNENCVEIAYKTDDFQTYFFDYNAIAGFVERIHTRTDEFGEHLVAEPVNSVEYKNHYVTYNEVNYDLTTIVLVASEMWDGTQWTRPTTLIKRNNQYMLASISVWPVNTHSSLASLLAAFTADSKVDSIISLFQVPDWAYDSLNQSYWGSRTTSLNIDISNIGGTYTPRNKKLFTSQFRRIKIATSDNAIITYKPEFFGYDPVHPNRVTATFLEQCNTLGTPSVLVEPTNYKGCPRDNCFSINNMPQVIINKDPVSDYMNQNALSTMMGILGGSLQKPSAAIGSALSSASNYVVGLDQAARASVPQVGTLSSNLNLARGLFGWQWWVEEPIRSEAERIDRFFDMYGYEVDTIMVPTRKMRNKFTYIKTRDYVVNGGIPDEAITTISNAYNSGVTFWADNANYMNYADAILNANVAGYVEPTP